MSKELDPEKKISLQETPEIKAIAVPDERTHFKKLMLSNPNFFGTFPDLGTIVKPIKGDTTFEQLTCLGLYPGSFFGGGRLEAVINIKQHSGYGTDACGSGSTEYVRFFVQDTAGAWHDLGLSSVQVYNLAGSLPVSYAVYVDFNQARKFCTTENILNVRAILSWDLEPTPGDPNFDPVWGNVVNARVQVSKRFLITIPLKELVAENVLSFQSAALAELDLEQPLPAKEAKELTFGELKTLYAEAKVPAHRFGFKDALKIKSGSLGKALTQITAHAKLPTELKEKTQLSSASLFADIGLGGILAQIDQLKGDTTFEELTCAGYNPQTRTLEGVIQVKQSNGFSGGLCTGGSTEFVSFFAFISGTWQSLGTAKVQVYDLAAVSRGPVNYAVFRISNVAEMPCQNLAGVPLRAILSWQTQPTGPNFNPTWGNVVNTHIQPQILTGGPEQMRLMRIGRVSIAGIDNVTGLANPTGVAGDCAGDNSPFGGSPTVTGDFIPRVDVFNAVDGSVVSGGRPIIYQAWVIPSVGSPSQITDSFGIQVYPPLGPAGGVFKTQDATSPPAPVIGGSPGEVYYRYMESDLQAVEPRTLAVFNTGSLPDGNYTIQIRGFKFAGGSYVAIQPQSKMIHVYNGYPHTELTAGGTSVTVRRPQVAISLLPPATDCGDIIVGDTITGAYSVTDLFFGSVSIRMLPITVAGNPQPINSVVLSNADLPGGNSVSYDGTNTNGTSGTFTLNTAGLTPCGYTILLEASDRALVNDSCSGHPNELGVGFCLREEEQ